MSDSDEYSATSDDETSVSESRQVFPVSQTADSRSERTVSMRVPGLTDTASHCLIKALHLAKEFNHAEVAAAHFIVAMTLVPRSNKQFSHRKLDASLAWRASMSALTDMERVLSNPGTDPPLSVELINVLTDAKRSAENRDNQEASIDDVLSAFEKLPSESAARRLVVGVTPHRAMTAAEEARDAVRRLEENLSRRFDGLNELLRNPPRVAQEPVPAGVLGWLGSQLGSRK